MKGASPFRAFWGLGRLGCAARLGLCKLWKGPQPLEAACGSRTQDSGTLTRRLAHMWNILWCVLPRERAGELWT